MRPGDDVKIAKFTVGDLGMEIVFDFLETGRLVVVRVRSL